MGVMSTIAAFTGLNNVGDSLRLGTAWLKQADNVDISDTGKLTKRQGYTKLFDGAVTGSYASEDFNRVVLVDNGDLKTLAGSLAPVTLRVGVGSEPMHFTEVNDQIFFSNSTESGIVKPGNDVAQWRWEVPPMPSLTAVTGALPAGLYRVCFTYTLSDGRETGAGDIADIMLGSDSALQINGVDAMCNVYVAPADSTVFQLAGRTDRSMVWNAAPDNLGKDLTTENLDPLPLGTETIQAWGGRIYAAQHFSAEDQSAVWASQPLGFHLFDLAKDVFIVPGKVLTLAPHDEALIVGTDRAIYAFDGKGLNQLAPYGVVPGRHWAVDDKRLLMWTVRGLCSAMPFTNLTERQVSVAPGLSAGGAIVHSNGQKRYVVTLKQGGAAFNSTSESST